MEPAGDAGPDPALLRRLREVTAEKARLAADIEAQRSRRAALLSLHMPSACEKQRTVSLQLPTGEVQLQVHQDALLAQAGVLWPSGVLLAEHLAQAGALHGLRVLELGCGVAPLPSLVACCMGVSEVVATDQSSGALELAARCLQENQKQFGCFDSPPIRFGSYVWNEAESPAGAPFDLVLGADLLYDQDWHKALAAVLAVTISSGGKALLSYEVRDPPSEAAFFGLLLSKGFEPPRELLMKPPDGDQRNEIRLVELRPSDTPHDGGLFL